ncbi:MAG: hypothetical protein NC489_08130 [Ruminococcus flavefaciens]|nr:hypothetical protein [Ruminococcus flavefaciens]
MSTLRIGDTVRLAGMLTLSIPHPSKILEGRVINTKCDYFTETTDLIITNLFILPEEADPEQEFPLMATVVDPTTYLSATVSTDYLIKAEKKQVSSLYGEYAHPDAVCTEDQDDDDDPSANPKEPTHYEVIARDTERCSNDDEEEDD